MANTKRALLLTDFSHTCYQSLTYGLEFCRHYGYVPEVLHVEVPRSESYVDVIERQKVSDIVGLYNKKFGLDARVVIKNGSLSETISDEVRICGINIIILGTHGRLGMQSVTGSAAGKIISSQEVPIIVVQSKRFVPIAKVLIPATINSQNPLHDGAGDVLKEFGAQWKIYKRDESFGFGLSRQSIDYACANGFDMLLCRYDELRNLQHNHSDIIDQLLFNIPQIPVMCC